MFDRKKYKAFARRQLQGRWTVPVIITIISALILIIFAIPEAVEIVRSIPEIPEIDFSDVKSVSIFVNTVSGGSSSSLLSYIQVAVEAILYLAAINVYLKMSRSPEKVSLSDFFEGMNNWFRALLAAIWKGIWLFLWLIPSIFLFMIPVIIKALAYSQIYFIVAEYKKVSIPRALSISKVITQGHKMDLFIMLMSFLGWAILASIPAFLGFLWLRPYMHMSFINAYHAMLKEAIETGRLKPEDLMIQNTVPEEN